MLITNLALLATLRPGNRSRDSCDPIGVVPHRQRRDDGDDDATDEGLRLSTATILPRWIMVEGGTAHG